MQFQQSCFSNFSPVYNAFLSNTSGVIFMKKKLSLMSIYWNSSLTHSYAWNFFQLFQPSLKKKKRYTFSSFSSHFFNDFFKKKIKFFWYPILPAFPASLATLLSYHYSIITIHVSCFNSPWATFERWSSFKGLLFQKNVVYIYIYIYTYI